MCAFPGIRTLNAFSILSLILLPWLGFTASAEVTRIEITDRQSLSDASVDYQYEVINGVMHFTLDPDNPDNRKVSDIQLARVNNVGLVEYSADFRLIVPPEELSNGSLVYVVNNRGGAGSPPGRFPDAPLYKKGFTYFLTGWINELEATNDRILLHAPLVGSEQQIIKGDVRYEVIVGQPANDVNIAGGGHLAYEPTEDGLANVSLTHRVNQLDPRIPIERSSFDLGIDWPEGRNQPIVTLNVDGGLQPGHIYELIYEAQNPVLAGAGMAGIRDSVALLRHGSDNQELTSQLESLGIPEIKHSIAIGNSQSGRLLRLFVYDGFNEDLAGRQVFDGVMPIIAGAGFGMFNNRFAMPTRTNGQHENELFPNDLFPFTYNVSTDPYSGRVDGILKKAMDTDTVPRVMHIQTSNEYWIRGGSLPHTDPLGSVDTELPDEVRFYTIGGSQHGSGDGSVPRSSSTTQLPRNPNMWTPFRDSLLLAMHEWIADGVEPPDSRYPRIADGSLVPSHLPDGAINPAAWNPLPGVNHPKDMYRVASAEYGDKWLEDRIVSLHPTSSTKLYGVLVPAVDSNNNDFPHSTLLPPLTQVPLATFVPWNLRGRATGAETELARLAGGYIPFAIDSVVSGDPRSTVNGLYRSFEDYLGKYEAVTDKLIDERYLLPEFKEDYMQIARDNRAIFD